LYYVPKNVKFFGDLNDKSYCQPFFVQWTLVNEFSFYSLDCREGHMKKNSLCVWLCVRVKGQKNINDQSRAGQLNSIQFMNLVELNRQKFSSIYELNWIEFENFVKISESSWIELKIFQDTWIELNWVGRSFSRSPNWVELSWTKKDIIEELNWIESKNVFQDLWIQFNSTQKISQIFVVRLTNIIKLEKGQFMIRI